MSRSAPAVIVGALPWLLALASFAACPSSVAAGVAPLAGCQGRIRVPHAAPAGRLVTPAALGPWPFRALPDRCPAVRIDAAVPRRGAGAKLDSKGVPRAL